MLHVPSDDDGPDARLTRRVATRLYAEPRLLGETITVNVQNRVVDLAGTVGSMYARITAADLARSTPGVVDVCNRLELARVADVSLLPDEFDAIVARWDEQPDPPGGTEAPGNAAEATGNAAGATGNAAEATGKAAGAESADPAQTFRVGAAITACIAVVLWVVALPELGAAALLIVVPFVATALALRYLARRLSSRSD
ncbi:BON domain-containing protein [Actinoplanes sp. NPDC023714]|uniref:BON domain-containing protein n=1 Tax=Actinoplanes sp. NPDC023714 TaxID=3154322 RepID=UPI0033DF4731